MAATRRGPVTPPHGSLTSGPPLARALLSGSVAHSDAIESSVKYVKWYYSRTPRVRTTWRRLAHMPGVEAITQRPPLAPRCARAFRSCSRTPHYSWYCSAGKLSCLDEPRCEEGYPRGHLAAWPPVRRCGHCPSPLAHNHNQLPHVRPGHGQLGSCGIAALSARLAWMGLTST